MRRQFRRPGGGGRIQNPGQRTGTVRNQVPQEMSETQVGRGVGRRLAERPANMRAEVEQKRRELQEKYRKEAAEAEQKRVRREKKKREDWLKRQESLVRPGHRLGSGRQPSMTNMRRDLVEHQNAIDPDPQGDDGYHEQEIDEQFRMLVQQGIERDIDTEELNRKIEHLGQEAYLQRRNEAMKNKMREEHPGYLNPRANFSNDASASTSNRRGSTNPRDGPYFSPSTPNARSSTNPRDGPYFSPSTPNARSSTNPRGGPYFSPSTPNARSSGNPRRQADFSIDAREPSSSTSDTRSFGNPRRQPDFIQNALLTSNTNSSTNPRKPANFLGVAYSGSPSISNARDAYNIAPQSSSNTDDADQQISGHILGFGDNANIVSPTSASRETEVDHREQMRAARLRMQAQYNDEVRRAEQAKDEEANNVAEGVKRISFT